MFADAASTPDRLAHAFSGSQFVALVGGAEAVPFRWARPFGGAGLCITGKSAT